MDLIRYAPFRISFREGFMAAKRVESAKPASASEVIAHWPHLIEGFEFSSQEFYALVEKALCERQIPQAEFTRIELPEGGLLSAKRTYLRVRRERLIFDICAAPFGTGFFVSTWFWEKKLKVRWDVLILMVVLGGIAYLHLNDIIGVVFGTIVVAGILILLIRGLRDFDAFLMKIPVIGFIYERFLRKMTYYRIDLTLQRGVDRKSL